MGKEAVKKLITTLQGKEDDNEQGLMVDGPTLVVRDSTSSPST